MTDKLIDTNVLSKIFYGNVAVKNYVENFEFAIDTVVYIECIQGSISNADKIRIKKTLQKIKIFEFNKAIGEKAMEIIDLYSNAHGLMLADAIIAATAIENNLTLVTYNIKDFDFIQGLKYDVGILSA